MRELNGTYAQDFNARHGRVGHLFQARYGAILVEKEPHLLEVARYIVLNPVRAGLCARAAEWPWSSYHATVGVGRCPSFLTSDWLLGQLGETRAVAQERYRAFVNDGEASAAPEPRGGLYLGSEEFIRRHSPDGPIEEVPRAQWEPIRPSLTELFGNHGEDAIVAAYYAHGYHLRDIARHLRIHPSTATRRLRRLELDRKT